MKNKVSEIKLSYRENIKSPVKVTSSRHAAEILYDHWDKGTIGLQESFKLMLLNNNHKVKGIVDITTGGITNAVVDLRILFAIIVKSLSTAVVVAHNHPSGVLTYSEADRQLTRNIKQCADFFDVTLLDHIILAPDGKYYSFADQGIL